MDQIYTLFLQSSGVQTDTRTIAHDCLFFCLKGGNFDGNTFAAEAIRKGALCVVIDNADYAIEGKTILVEDTLIALQQLAQHHRRQFQIPIIGITGSNGKTTSKELIATVLQTQYKVLYTNGNLNNHIGVPLTLLQLNATHEIAVIEMGANKPGDIRELAEIAEPTHGIITNIGRAHLEGFKTLEGVIQTKSELYHYIHQNRQDGVLFLNSDDEILLKAAPAGIKLATYGNSGEVSGQLLRLSPYVEMTWSYGSSTSPELKTHLVGQYNFINFLAAIRIGVYFDVTPENCSKAIERYVPSNNRSQITETAKNTLIVDCYNANPTSMRSAIESFALIDNHIKIFILGDMREMGDDAEMVHEEIVQLTIEHRLSGFFVGEEFLKWKHLHPNAIFLKSTEPLSEHFSQNPPEGLLILLKGSRGIQLEKLLPLL
ncbi:MAG: UDP-N-acetylmuramoyl-tripeptide--D-alanyl-D-alanine ligase [Bacteroidota bacterium]